MSAADLQGIVLDAITEAVSRITATRKIDDGERAGATGTDDALMTSREVCQALHVTKPTLWRWEQAKKLVPVRIDGMLRYRRSDVNNIINKK